MSRQHTLRRDGDVPLRDQVLDELRALIGRLEESARLPTEAEIMESYGVSRTTVRHAVDTLVKEGLVVRQRGRGTFVRSSASSAVQLTHDVAFVNSLEVDGKVDIGLVDYRWTAELDQSARDTLDRGGLTQHQDVPGWIKVQRMLCRDNRPLAFASNWIPEPLANNVSKGLLESTFIYAALNELGVKPASATFSVSCRRPSQAAADRLMLAEDPGVVLEVTRATLDENGSLCLISVFELPTAGIELHFTSGNAMRLHTT